MKNIALIISGILFVVFGLGDVVISIYTLFHALANPEMTCTQYIYWVFEDGLRTFVIVGSVIAYLVMAWLASDDD